MSDKPEVNEGRRALIGWTAGASAVAGAGAAAPFVASMFPSERAKAAGAPVEVDISRLEPGGKIDVEWQGKVVWVVRRTKDMIDSVKKSDPLVADPDSKSNQQPAYAKNELRSIKPDFLVAVGICSHLGCSPTFKPEENVFFCPCHGSKFDLAGRVYKGVPAPTNLIVPEHTFLTETRLLIGEDKKA
jgi:ubiquinol-cytochrome c reductase iron-sulfur subunit